MRIAQVSPLFERVPPHYYGGTERVVSWLTEELVQQGHEVTLFASGDSVTHAELVAVTRSSLRLGRSWPDPIVPHLLLLERVWERSHTFDIIHFHLDHLQYSVARRMSTPTLSTLHGRLDMPDLVPLFREFSDVPVVSVSDAQREPLPWLAWAGTVLHGLPTDRFVHQPRPGGYLAFIGRIAPEKRLDRAIEIARRVGLPLKVAAKIDDDDRPYFDRQIAPLLRDSMVEYVGEVTEDDKQAFLGDALALLFPIDWPEPFGLVMIEAMACGTPIVAFRAGSVPEVIDDGLSGFIVDDVDGAVRAVERIGELSRATVRSTFEARFTADRMARDYLAVYERVIGERESQVRWASVGPGVADSLVTASQTLSMAEQAAALPGVAADDRSGPADQRERSDPA